MLTIIGHLIILFLNPKILLIYNKPIPMVINYKPINVMLNQPSNLSKNGEKAR